MPWIVINALCHLKNYTALRDNWELNPPHTILPPHLATQIDIIIQQQSKRCVLPNPAFKLNSVTSITQFPRRPFRPSFKSHFFFHTPTLLNAHTIQLILKLSHIKLFLVSVKFRFDYDTTSPSCRKLNLTLQHTSQSFTQYCIKAVLLESFESETGGKSNKEYCFVALITPDLHY